MHLESASFCVKLELPTEHNLRGQRRRLGHDCHPRLCASKEKQKQKQKQKTSGIHMKRKALATFLHGQLTTTAEEDVKNKISWVLSKDSSIVLGCVGPSQPCFPNQL